MKGANKRAGLTLEHLIRDVEGMLKRTPSSIALRNHQQEQGMEGTLDTEMHIIMQRVTASPDAGRLPHHRSPRLARRLPPLAEARQPWLFGTVSHSPHFEEGVS